MLKPVCWYYNNIRTRFFKISIFGCTKKQLKIAFSANTVYKYNCNITDIYELCDAAMSPIRKNVKIFGRRESPDYIECLCYVFNSNKMGANFRFAKGATKANYNHCSTRTISNEQSVLILVQIIILYIDYQAV